MYRLYIDELDSFHEAIELLDDYNIPYDLDSGDRIMIEEDFVEDAMEFLDNAGIDYEEI